MSNIKPSTHGIVVDHKEVDVRYAISDEHYNPDLHRKVRDLKPGETVQAFTPLRKSALSGATADPQDPKGPETATKSVSDGSEALSESSAKTTSNTK